MPRSYSTSRQTGCPILWGRRTRSNENLATLTDLPVAWRAVTPQYHDWAAALEHRQYVALGHYRVCLPLAPVEHIRQRASIALAQGMFARRDRREDVEIL